MSGGAVRNDLIEMERFIQNLQTFNSELQDSASNLSANWGSLGEVWQDQEYDRFAGIWEEALNSIKKYLDQSPEFVSHLQQKAEPLRQYLGG